MISSTFRALGIAALAAASIALSACNAGHTRGMFSGKVIGKTEAEIIDTYGQPAIVDRSDPEHPQLVYKAKTFDPDNANRIDPETIVFLAKEKDGRVIANDIAYRG